MGFKAIFKKVIKTYLPNEIYNRKDKMGFPTPINSWFKNELNDWICDILILISSKGIL